MKNRFNFFQTRLNFGIVIALLTFFSFVVKAQQDPHPVCKTSERMLEHYQLHPEAFIEKQNHELFTQQFVQNFQYHEHSNGPTRAGATYRIPVVFHVYGTTQNGKSVTLQLIQDALAELNKDFNGQNSDFGTVHNTFMPVRGTISISFELAQIDPNGNPTTGVEFLPVLNGYGNAGSYDAQIAADAWDNYKYMNVYIQADIYNNGGITESGVAWYPSTSDSDAGIARVVYNGQYVGTNTDSEFASILTHEFGHFMNLAHTFLNGCNDPDNDFVADTPPCDQIYDGCHASPSSNFPLNCYSQLVNAENYMDYRAVDGCYKMFTQGQIARMEAALQHPARITLWQTSNLIATGLLPSGPTVIIASSSGNSVCDGQAKTFTSNVYNTTSPTYQWFIDGISVPGATASTFTTASLTTGQVVSCEITEAGSPYSSNSITVTVQPIPATPTITSTSPICNGATLNLTTPTVTGGSFQWSGPAGFTSIVQNPVINNTNSSNAGIYSLILTVSGCASSPATSVVSFSSGITPTVTISTASTTVCESDLVDFTAVQTDGGSNPVFQWKVNGVNTGTNSSTFQSGSLMNGNTVTCVITSNSSCLTSPTATSNSIVMIVKPKPSIPTANSNSPVCQDAAIELSVSTVTGAVYNWSGPNNFVSNQQNPIITNAGALNTGNYSLTVTVNGCSSDAGTTSVSLATPVVPAISIATPMAVICEGQSLEFTATSVNEGNSPIYQWKVNGVNAGANNVIFTASSLTGTSTVTCVLTSSEGCTTSSNVTSNPITITVNPVPVTPVITSNTPVCSGNAINLSTASVIGATYQWTGPNSYSSSLQNPQLSGATTFMTGTYSLIITKNGCSSVAGTTQVVVNSSVTPTSTIAITAGQNPNCSGQPVTFTVTGQNGGTSPIYQWKVNGQNASTGTTFTSTTLNDGDVLTCNLTSNVQCATSSSVESNPITMTVNTSLQPSITLSSSVTSVCIGSSVTFTAIGQNGGANPSYTWQLNGSVIQGQNLPFFTASNLNNGDVVKCIYTSTAACASPTSVTSTPITIQVTPMVTPTIQISTQNNTVCQGESAVFSATVTNQGTSPQYEWKRNGVVVANGSSYSVATLQSNDIITCSLYSNATCASTPYVTSNSITMTVKPQPTANATSNSPICEGQNITLIADDVNGAVYSWSGPAYSSTEQNPVITNAQVAQSGIYTFSATLNGCTSIATVEVDVNETPIAPTITQLGSLLVSSVSTGNQWYRNGVLIQGATSQTFHPTQSGNYTVIATNGPCESDASTPYFISVVGMDEEIVNSFQVYPNPTEGRIHLEGQIFNNDQDLNISVLSSSGQLMLQDSLVVNDGVISKIIDLSQYGSGVYFLSIKGVADKVNRQLRVVVL